MDDFNSGVNCVKEGVYLYKKMKLRFQGEISTLENGDPTTSN